MKRFLQRLWNYLNPPEIREAKQRVIEHAQNTYTSYRNLSASLVRSDSEKMVFRVDYRGPARTRPTSFLVYEFSLEQDRIRELCFEEACQYVCSFWRIDFVAAANLFDPTDHLATVYRFLGIEQNKESLDHGGPLHAHSTTRAPRLKS
jgi:hypothetical protein